MCEYEIPQQTQNFNNDRLLIKKIIVPTPNKPSTARRVKLISYRYMDLQCEQQNENIKQLKPAMRLPAKRWVQFKKRKST